MGLRFNNDWNSSRSVWKQVRVKRLENKKMRKILPVLATRQLLKVQRAELSRDIHMLRPQLLHTFVGNLSEELLALHSARSAIGRCRVDVPVWGTRNADARSSRA